MGPELANIVWVDVMSSMTCCYLCNVINLAVTCNSLTDPRGMEG